MNKFNIQKRRNDCMRLVRISNRKPNGLYWHSGETWEHVLTKLRICYLLKSEGQEFLTEAIFNNGERCDILNLDEGVIYEIINSETKESIEKKKKSYPLPLIVIDANKEFKEIMIR